MWQRVTPHALPCRFFVSDAAAAAAAALTEVARLTPRSLFFSASRSPDSHRPVQQHHRDGGRRLVQGHHGPGGHSDRTEQQVPALPGPHEMRQGNKRPARRPPPPRYDARDTSFCVTCDFVFVNEVKEEQEEEEKNMLINLLGFIIRVQFSC